MSGADLIALGLVGLLALLVIAAIAAGILFLALTLINWCRRG